jgi:hypothetical protein
MTKALNISDKAYKKMSIQGREHVNKNYSFKQFNKNWIDTMDRIVDYHGSWETRKNYKRWHLMEVA